MDKILLINACVRPGSRTLELTETLLQKLKGDVQTMKLYETQLPALDLNNIEKRNQAAQNNDFSDTIFLTRFLTPQSSLQLQISS